MDLRGHGTYSGGYHTSICESHKHLPYTTIEPAVRYSVASRSGFWLVDRFSIVSRG